VRLCLSDGGMVDEVWWESFFPVGKPAKVSWTELASSVDNVQIQVDDLHERRHWDGGHEVVSGGLHVTIAHHVAYDRVMHGRVICGWSRSSERHPCCARVTGAVHVSQLGHDVQTALVSKNEGEVRRCRVAVARGVDKEIVFRL
jgi:hypothetical protein